MSGPKTSQYTLTPEQRRILAEQRELERRKAVASETVKRSAAKLCQIGSLQNGKRSAVEKLLAGIWNDGGYSAKLAELDSVINAAEPFFKMEDSNNVDSLERKASVLMGYLKKAERLSDETEIIIGAFEHRKSAASDRIKKTSASLHRLGSLHSDKKAIADELNLRLGSDGGYSAKLEELRSLIGEADPAVSKTDGNNLASLEKTAAYVADRLKKAERLSAEMGSIVKDNDIKLHSELLSNIDKGFETSFAELENEKNNSENVNIEIDISRITEKLNTAKLIEALPGVYISEINNAIEILPEIKDKNFLKNYIALNVSPLLKKCNEYKSEYEKLHGEFEKLFTEYVSLCGMYYLAVQEYICSASSVEKLKTEIERIKRIADEDDEQTYISESLDEVMEEMGYSVIGSREVTKKNGRHFRNELYSYSDGTAVNVTFSSDGKIAMELGGIDSSDRLPDEKETEVLCGRMEEFCDDFKEIEKLLAKKGVVLGNRISLLPPDASYAQIINTSDYRLDGKVESIKTKRKSRKQTTQKVKKAE